MSVRIFLTFDCEDFVNDRSVCALYYILKLLHQYHVRGLFFLTGHLAERISRLPEILDLLKDEQIGYHSSAHSVRPIIIEYTDVENYALARQFSLERETRHINPITGELEGKGGLILLRNLFPNKKITSFRAPAFSYSPPHLEALKELGISFDFSATLSPRPINFKDITFYPFPMLFDALNPLFCASACAREIHRYLAKSPFSVLGFHPDYFVNSGQWDSMYFSGNPERLYTVQARKWKETRLFLRRFELLLKILGYAESKGLCEVTPAFEEGERKGKIESRTVIKNYQKSLRWGTEKFGYKPRFMLNHYMEFFDMHT